MEAKKREEEEKVWQSSETSDTEEAWQQFIKTYPDSSRIKAARKRLSEAKARAAEKERVDASKREPTKPPVAADIEPTVRLRLPDERALEKLEKTLPLPTPAVLPLSKAPEADKTARISTGFQKPAAAIPAGAPELVREKAIPMPARTR